MNTQHISVRELVEFILRAGDIDNRTDAGPDPEAMQAGSRIHRKIQSAQGGAYRAEVPLSVEFTRNGLTISVEGRADGILRSGGGVTVDEIKAVYEDVRRMTEPRPLHLAQAKCYAAMILMRENLAEISCQMTYCGIESGEVKKFLFSYSAGELTDWMNGLVERYFRFAENMERHRRRRNKGAASLAFPYAYRKGQKETAVNVYRAIRRGKNLFLQAPTGMGKTLSVTYPAVRSMGEALTDRIFYLSAKSAAQKAALDAFSLLRSAGMPLRVCLITAKEKICLNEVFDCNPDSCPFARGHFDRVNDAVYSLITGEELITEAEIRKTAEAHRVCPYELSLDASVWCDAVVADYNYAFDPRVRLRRYFSEGADRNSVFLIDEAHNLVERAEEMYSASLRKEDVLSLKRLLRPYGIKARSAADAVNRTLLSVRRSLEDYPAVRASSGRAAVLPAIDFLMPPLERLYGALKEFLEERRSFPERPDVLKQYFEIRTFLSTAETMDERYRVLALYGADETFEVRLLCVDPSEKLKDSFSFCRSAVFFSATLLPVRFYKELLTGNPDEYAIYTESPFRTEQRLLLASADVSMRYDRRTRGEYEKIAAYIRTAARVKPGNYLCFFPSYQSMNAVAGIFAETAGKETAGKEMSADAAAGKEAAGDAAAGLPQEFFFREGALSCRILVQSPSMSREGRERFLSAFLPDGEAAIGFCVLGGIFSEGIDLREESLIGTMIAGTGLPAINAVSEVRKSFFDQMGKDGFDYAYRYPGMNKVQQAAGRLIRTTEDRGVILLLDSRFLLREYRALFPKEWSDCRRTDLRHVEKQLREFWEKAGRE